MPLYSDEAIVLRTHKLAEADRIITLLTRHHGVVRAVAKGVRRTTSRFGSRLEPFTHVDLQLAVGRNLDTITQAETLAPYGAAISADYDQYTAGSVMLETAERLVSEEHQPSVQQYLRGGLRALLLGLCQLRAGGTPSIVQPGRGRDPVRDLPGARIGEPDTCHAPAARRAAGGRLGGRGRLRAAHPARGEELGRGVHLLAPRAWSQVPALRR
jgi:hypothetical protein